jgi:outer membrane lipoprotein-sorting protein
MAADFNQVINSREIYSGKFWLSKKGKTKVKVKYTSGLNQDVLIIGDKVVVVDNEKSKKYRYSISQTPLYSILSGSLDLSRENSEVIENSDVLLRLKINKSSMFGGMSITLVFSKYKESGNIKNLEAWIVDDGKTETLFSFDIDSLSVNDEKKVPQEVFN